MKSLSEMLTLIVYHTYVFPATIAQLVLCREPVGFRRCFRLVTKNYAALLGKSRNQAESKIIDLCQNAFVGLKKLDC